MTDPIITAISSHRRAFAAFVAAGEAEDGADVAHGVEVAAFRKIATTPPATLAGALAALRYIRTSDRGINVPDGWLEAFSRSLILGLRGIEAARESEQRSF